MKLKLKSYVVCRIIALSIIMIFLLVILPEIHIKTPLGFLHRQIQISPRLVPHREIPPARKKCGIHKFISNVRPFSGKQLALYHSIVFEVLATKTFGGRERSRALLVPSFRALWMRRRLDSLATAGVIPFFDNDHPRKASTRYHTLLPVVSFLSPLHLAYLPTPQSLRRPEFGVSANSSFFSRFLSLGGRDYWEAVEF